MGGNRASAWPGRPTCGISGHIWASSQWFAIILGFAGYAARQARSGAGGTWGVRLVRGARWSQPVLIVLIVESALVVNYNLWLSNLFGVSVPHFPTVALVATLLVAGVLVFWLERGAPTAGRLASLGVAALIIT